MEPSGLACTRAILSEATFALIVDMGREIMDAVKPTRTVYALETMPWSFPDLVESYVRLVEVELVCVDCVVIQTVPGGAG